MRTLIVTGLVLAIILVISTITPLAQEPLTPQEICDQALPAPDPETRTFSQAEPVLEEGVDYGAVFCTDVGPIYVDLFEKYVPETVNNFVFLAQQGYYNNTTFHRVMEGFMAQGGDPTGMGTGNPGYQFNDEFVGFLFFDQPGILAMANAGANTNGSQFFLTTAATEGLNFQYSIFGMVLDGYDNLLNIQIRDPNAGGPATTLDTVVIVDPATVATDYEFPAFATQDDVVASFEAMRALLPGPADGFDYTVEPLTTAEVVESAPDSERDAVATLLEQYGHEYRVQSQITHNACDFADVPFASIGYTLDAYGSAEDAAAAIADETMDAWLMADGFSELAESPNIALPMRVMETSVCDSGATHALTQWQRGRFVATVEVVIPDDNSNIDYLDYWLTEIVGTQVYEYGLADVLRPEIWRR